ncbi:MAG TPA: pyridoxal phosphate-dependent aminotransferase [Stellaceae bacterium]|jgi:arginine:pyruvate transaminase|nr:pyridoxal phosphate-dependent aminotransferase [Stellaceae bacterium]
MRYSPLVARIGGAGASAWAIHFEASRRRAAGDDIIMLTVGDPDQDPPAVIIEETIASLRRHRTGYAPIIGYPAVREAIAGRTARRSGQPCGADNVVIVPGAQGGIYCAVQCLAGPGDEIIVMEPVYATYGRVIEAAGARMVSVPLRASTGFHPDIDAIAAAITPRTRIIWINTPHNPTGAVFTAAEVEAIAALCRRHDLWLLSDEVYEDLAFVRPHVGAWSLPGMAERTVIVSSLSKSHAIPGFRLGWVIGPPLLSQHMFHLLLALFYGGPGFIQDGALVALRQELPEVAALREAYRGRAAMLSALLREAPGCRVVEPEGGMFVLLDVGGSRLDGDAFAHALLDREAVAVLPCGGGFGPSVANHLRIALSAPEPRLCAAGERIVRFARSLATG